MYCITLYYILKSIINYAYNLLNCLEDETFIPDLTLLSKLKNDNFEYICAAGNNVRDSAIIFITNVKSNNEDYISSNYRTKDDHKNNEIGFNYNCNFDDTCTKYWLTNKLQHKVIDSDMSPYQYIAPVIDERWEKFDPFYISPNSSVQIDLKAGKSISFSFRSKDGTSLLLYNLPDLTISQDFYYIKFNPKIIILKCENQIISKIVLESCREIKRSNIEVDFKIWQHFLITINKNISIFKYNIEEEKIVEFENKLNINIQFLRFMQEEIKHNNGLLKIHKYKYLSLQNSVRYELGPQIEVDKRNNAICVEFYALVCKNCRIEFSLDANSKKVIEGNAQKKLQSWQYVRLLVETAIDTKMYYRLNVRNLLYYNSEIDVLAIDDIRRCRENENRFITMTTSNETNISCQSLKHPSFSISKKIRNSEYKGSKICDDKTRIGNNCNISCKAITNEHFCNKYTICKFNNEKKSHCSCGIGYSGKYCENKVPLPYLRDALTLVQSTINSITVRLKSDIIEEQGDFKINSFGVEYKEKNDYTWIPTNKRYTLSTNIHIPISNLKSEVEYSFRAILYSSNEKFLPEKNVKIAYFKTICNNVPHFIENLKIDVGETNANITWDPICNNELNFKLNCDTNKQNDEWCKEPTKNNLKGIKNLSKTQYLQELSPFSKYQLTISNNNSEMNSTYFITKPSAQNTAVQNLTAFARTDKYISIRWKPPQVNETISYYERFSRKCYAYDIPERYTAITYDVVPCDIWPDWLCSNISQISPTNCYQIYIRGFYQDREMSGYEKYIIIQPNTESSPPENIKFKPETSSICWNHPNFIQGQINNFAINIVQVNSTLLIRKNSGLTVQEIPQTNKLEYCTELNPPLDLSSTYEIRIRTESTRSFSKYKHLIIDTEPIVSELKNDIIIGTRTNTTQEVTIPEITPETLTMNSVIYVQICYENSTKIIKTNIKNFDNLTNCNGISWIAAKFTDIDQEHNFIIGDFSRNGEEAFIENTSLNQSTSYNVHVILINVYKGQESYKIYTIKIDDFADGSSWNPLYLLLLLLLFIPIIAFIVFKKTKSNFFIPSFNNGSNTSRNDNSNLLPLNKFDKNVTENNSLSAPLLENTTSNNFSHIVIIKNLSQYVKNSLENGELQKQHELLTKGGTKPWEYGMMKENKFKNRYNNLTAYDHSRVVLNQMRGDPFSDFINANYIDGYKQKNAYIATQGPKPNTINDFWRMIWKENVMFIVMLANLTEGGKKKCEKYWPEIGVTQEYVNLSVTYIKSDIYADFEYRTFEVISGQEKRLVQQLHFTSWPDHGVPLYPQSLVPFLRKMTAIPVDNAPIVVHCSAGVGRTGTIILTDICIRMATAEGQIDALKYLHVLRENRANMVDNFSQYKLVHMVLLEYLLAPETTIPCDENMSELIENLIKTGQYQKQLSYLEETTWHNMAMTTKTAMNTENLIKNRFPRIVPGDSRIFISRYPYDDENSDYINAIPVDGFQIKDQFIVTQNPLPNTLKDFWRMVDEQNCKVIVSLNEFELNDESCRVFWPYNGEEMKPMPHFIIEHKNETSFDCFDVIKVRITNQNAEEGNESSIVKIIQLKKWKRDAHLPENPKSLIGLFEEAHSSSRDGSPMIITCFDGTTACGVFVALSFVIEKIKLEQLCDVSLATRVVRCNREQFIINWHQFLFLYKAALEYVNSFEEYGNFQGPSIIKQ